MELDKQVCSLELAKRLKELGVKQVSFFVWEGVMADVGRMRFSLKRYKDNHNPERYAAFTVAELGEMLPKGYWDEASVNGGYEVGYSQGKPIGEQAIDRYFVAEVNEADARAKMLVYLLVHDLIERGAIIDARADS